MSVARVLSYTISVGLVTAIILIGKDATRV